MDGHSSQPKSKARVAFAERMLLQGESIPKVNHSIQESFNLKERQARTIVTAALDQIANVWSDVDRPRMIAARMVQLEVLAEKAIEAKQYKTALGCWQHADKLMQLTEHTKPQRSNRYRY